jgi:hypothetical protein
MCRAPQTKHEESALRTVAWRSYGWLLSLQGNVRRSQIIRKVGARAGRTGHGGCSTGLCSACAVGPLSSCL